MTCLRIRLFRYSSSRCPWILATSISAHWSHWLGPVCLIAPTVAGSNASHPQLFPFQCSPSRSQVQLRGPSSDPFTSSCHLLARLSFSSTSQFSFLSHALLPWEFPYHWSVIRLALWAIQLAVIAHHSWPQDSIFPGSLLWDSGQSAKLSTRTLDASYWFHAIPHFSDYSSK